MLSEGVNVLVGQVVIPAPVPGSDSGAFVFHVVKESCLTVAASVFHELVHNVASIEPLTEGLGVEQVQVLLRPLSDGPLDGLLELVAGLHHLR